MTKEGILTAVDSGSSETAAAIRQSDRSPCFHGICHHAPLTSSPTTVTSVEGLHQQPVSAAMRGHGFTHTRFACDMQMGMIAEELGIDPLEIRLRNAIDNPSPRATILR